MGYFEESKLDRYTNYAEQYKAKIRKIREQIKAYEDENSYRTEVEKRQHLISLRRDLIKSEIQLNGNYYGIYKEGGYNTQEGIKKLQKQIYEDISLLQNDLCDNRTEMTTRYNAIQKNAPYDLKTTSGIKKEIIYRKTLYTNTRELLYWQDKKIKYAKCMNDSESYIAKDYQNKLRSEYAKEFDILFNLTIRGINTVTQDDKLRLWDLELEDLKDVKEFMQQRSELIGQGQIDSSKKGGQLILEKPKTLQNICDKANRVTGYKRNIEEYIEQVEEKIEFTIAEQELYNAEQRLGQIKEEEEKNRYNPDWVIPDEEFVDEEGYIQKYNDIDDEER